MLPSTPTLPAGNKYDAIQRALHWTMAVVIIVAVLIGLYCSFQVPGTPVRRFLLEIHKSLGMTALVLLVVRVVYRLVKGAPAYAEPLGRLVHLGASAGHLGLYAIMLFMPVTGYIYSAAGGNSLPWFWLFQWPRIVSLDKPLAHLGAVLHGWGAYAIYALLALHIAAVVWHQWVKKDGVLARMLP
jgi:cytochrome b561